MLGRLGKMAVMFYRQDIVKLLNSHFFFEFLLIRIYIKPMNGISKWKQ